MRGIGQPPAGVRRTTRQFLLSVIGAIAAVGSILPATALGSTVGVPNLEQVPVSDTGILSQPPPYSVWQSGNRDGSTAFYASENGYLTEVSVAHWNTADVTVRIYVFRRDGGGCDQSRAERDDDASPGRSKNGSGRDEPAGNVAAHDRGGRSQTAVPRCLGTGG